MKRFHTKSALLIVLALVIAMLPVNVFSATPVATPTSAPKAEVGTTTAVTMTGIVSTDSAPAPEPTTRHTYDMNDPNVLNNKMWVEVTSVEDIKARTTDPEAPWIPSPWMSGAEHIALAKEQSKDTSMWAGSGGVSAYESIIIPVQKVVETYLQENNLTIEGKTDFEKTEIIKQFMRDMVPGALNHNPPLEDFVRIWEPEFNRTIDCSEAAQSIYYLMLVMDFELFGTAYGIGPGGADHAWNAYWDTETGAMRFLDSTGYLLWNHNIDELDELGEQGYTLDNISTSASI